MAKRKWTKTYEAKMGGKKVCVTIPEDPDPAHVRVKEHDVQREADWFREEIENMIGNGLAHLMDDVGL